MPINNFSTIFANGRPKHWALHRCGRSETGHDFSSNTVVENAPGVTISDVVHLPTDSEPGQEWYHNSWVGLKAAGWGFGGSSPEFDIQAKLTDITYNTSGATRGAKYGLGMESHRMQMGGGGPTLLFCGIWADIDYTESTVTPDVHKYVFHLYEGAGVGVWQTKTIIGESADIGVVPSSADFRIIRTSRTSFEGQYSTNDGDTWNSLGTWDATSYFAAKEALVHSAGTGPTVSMSYMSPALMVWSNPNMPDTQSAKFSSFTHTSGEVPRSISLVPSDLSDDFGDDVWADFPKWSPFAMGGSPGANTSFGEGSGFANYARFPGNFAGDLANVATRCFYPGSDIDIEFQLKGQYCGFAAGAGESLGVSLKNMDYLSQKNGTVTMLIGNGGSSNQALLTYIDLPGAATALPSNISLSAYNLETSIETCRITRIGNVFTFYRNAGQIHQWTDTENVMTDTPLTMVVSAWQPISTYADHRIYDLTVAAGDVEITLEPTDAFFIENESPSRNSAGSAANAVISFDIADPDSVLNESLITATVRGNLAYDGTSFLPPFDSGSSISPIVTGDGHDGYRLQLVSSEDLKNYVSVRTHVGTTSLDDAWGFLIGSKLNSLYFSDAYNGIQKIDQTDLIGESQVVVESVISEDSATPLVSNSIKRLSHNVIDGYFYLVASYDGYLDGYGASLITGEVDLKTYADGYSANDAQISGKGILYLINETNNTVEAYYGSDFRGDFSREADFTYSASSTPAIMPGEILALHVVDKSIRLDGGARLYVGTDTGATRIDAYDFESSDGYTAGLESAGISTHYGIIGSGAQFEAIGGTDPAVTNVSSDDDNLVFFVSTADGLSQISLSGNKRLLFYSEANGLLPSNTIRHIKVRGE